MIKKIILILLCFSYISLFSQEQLTKKQIDSILSTLYTSKTLDVGILEPGLTELYYKSRDINYDYGKIESLLRLSAFYLNVKRDPEKVNADLGEVEKLALDKDDYFYYCKALALRAGLFANLLSFEKSEAMLKKGSGFFRRIRNKNKKNYISAYYDSRYINLYALQGKKDLVFFYAKQMYQTSLQLPDRDQQKINFVTIAARVLTGIYAERKQFSKADYYLKVQEKYLKKLNNVFDIGMYHKTKGTLFFDQGFHKSDLDSALYHFDQAELYIRISNNSIVLADLYSRIADVYQRKDDDENRLLYFNHSVSVKDSLQRIQRADISKIDADAIIPEFDQEIVDSYNVKNTSNFGIQYYLFVILILLALSFMILWLKKRKTDHYEKVSVAKEIEPDQNSNILYKNNSKIVELTDQALSGDKAFFINFMKEFPDFRDKLMDVNPNIKVSDIEFCAMLKLNLQVKQIAEIKKMSVPAVTAKKRRIRQKLNLDTKENMHLWLNHL